MRAYTGVGDWRSYTAKRDIRDLAIDRNNPIWAATSGGMFSYHLTDSTFQQFTTSEGLKTIDITAITVDIEGCVWVGASTGFLHRYNPTRNLWQYVSDIALKSDPQKRINALQVAGDTLFILSDIGLSVFSISRMEFGDTYTRFGSSSNQINGNVTAFQLFNGNMWVGTRNGIASTSITNLNPSVPESWLVYKVTQGIASNYINAFGIDYDSLFVGTRSGLSVFDGVRWHTDPLTNGLDILDLSTGGTLATDCSPSCDMFFMTKDAVWIYAYPLEIFADQFSSDLTSFTYKKFDNSDLTSTLILGTRTEGIITIDVNSLSTSRSIFPPGPFSNKFVGVAVDNRGVVWSGTGTGNGDGFMSFNGSAWRSCTANTDNRLGSNNYYKVSIGKDNAKWVSSWGNGVALLDDQGIIQKVLNTTNGLPPSIDPTFIVVGGTATDQNDITWIVNRTGRGDTALTKFNPDSSFSYAKGLNNRDIVFTDIVIDHNGTKWLANFSRFESVLPTALYYYNEHVTLPGTSLGWGKLTTSDGLTSIKVYSLAVGKEGELWIGTDLGISIIFDPSYSLRSAQYHPLRDQIAQAMVVDALNNKWVATKQGVFVLSSDGTSILNRYTVENSEGKLLDNDVASIAIDNNSGTVYFGTEKGLSSLGTAAVEPERAFNELRFSPNPLYLPSTQSLLIDGLVQNSLIKILSIDGNLIREIRPPGGRIGFWDGRDAQGELANSGVYIVVAYSEDGNQVASGKIAIIRR